MARHIIDIDLNEDEEKLIEWLRNEAKEIRYLKAYKPTAKQILRELLSLQIWEEIQIHADDVGIER